ncbi:hypothetical protein [Cohnella sp. 56]
MRTTYAGRTVAAYVRLYVEEGQGVTSCQEMRFDDIPEAARKQAG